jgi:hypothetical protein
LPDFGGKCALWRQ